MMPYYQDKWVTIRCKCPSRVGDGYFDETCKCSQHRDIGCSGFIENEKETEADPEIKELTQALERSCDLFDKIQERKTVLEVEKIIGVKK